MGKYIDAEKLIKVIEGKGLDCSFALKMERLDTLAIIDKLQKEQPEVDLEKEIDKFLKSEESTTYENAGSYKVAVKDPKKIARHFFELGLNARVVQPDYTYNSKEFLEKKIEELHKEVAVLKKEQSQILDEVDLEKFTVKIKTFQGRYKHPEIVSIKGAMAFMARLFYQYPNVARQWYEQLPKATMD